MIHVVTGPPCAGKTTYIRERKSAGAVVVDFDSLAVALGADSGHRCEGDVRKAAIVARHAVIAACKKYSESWVIHTSLDAHDRPEYSGARFHDLDPGEDVCVARAVADGRPEGTIGAIRAWYANRGSTHANVRRSDPRTRNGSARRKVRARLRARHDPCWICQAFGRSGEIDYSLPAGHPYSFEVDEIVPVSLGGSPYDMENVAASHRCCNEWRGNKTVEQVMAAAAAQSESAGAMPTKQRHDPCSVEW